jgi:major type 1 subunit fimbrin (pilin)
MKINHYISAIIISATASSFSYAAPVSGGTIHFTGELVNAACAVSTSSDGQTVNLGQYRTAAFNAVGDTSASIPFNIVLNDCSTDVAKTASVAFAGQTDSINPALLAVNSGGNSSTASGVGIEILDQTSKALTPDGATFSTALNLIDGNNTMALSARYKSTSAAPTAGSANADATFVIDYE